MPRSFTIVSAEFLLMLFSARCHGTFFRFIWCLETRACLSREESSSGALEQERNMYLAGCEEVLSPVLLCSLLSLALSLEAPGPLILSCCPLVLGMPDSLVDILL